MDKKSADDKFSCPDRYIWDFCLRVCQAREGIGVSQAEMAERLGVNQGTYKNYEMGLRKAGNLALSRKSDKRPVFRLMPMCLLEKFCEITKKSMWELVTGKPDALRPGHGGPRIARQR